MREDVARRMAEGDTFSSTAGHYYNRLTELFRQIDQGDESIGLPPYNGGLFAPEAAPILQRSPGPGHGGGRRHLRPSATRRRASEDNGARRFVNYRRHVGAATRVHLRTPPRTRTHAQRQTAAWRSGSTPYARKDSGSFYTPQELVDLIVDQTLKPLAEERLRAFEAQGARSLRPIAAPRPFGWRRWHGWIRRKRVLRLKVLDPAMGSGHFLVSAVDFLSDYIAELIEYVPGVPEWSDGAYESPLVGRIAEIRRGILHRAQAGKWIIDVAQLTDQAIIRRMVLKRCIYGVDKNRLTVELAKVSLWLHSFTVGAPLSFLDHHLRCGDSLIGIRVRDAIRELDRLGGLFAGSAMAGAEVAAEGMARIEEMSDADVVEVHESASAFRGVEETTADLRGLLDFLCGLQWLTAGMKATARSQFETPLAATLSRKPTDAYRILARGPDSGGDGAADVDPEHWATLRECWQEARAIARREAFLHWQAAFPGVWRHWQNRRPEGGFDAVIGNPPWDRIKLQEVEWFATRAREIALAPTAAARRAAIRRLRDRTEPLAVDFDAAKERADQLGRMVRASRSFPLLGGGDINLYSLFVERAMSLVTPDGLVGLLTPSGIYADKTAARFFKSLSTTGRIGGLFDFENRRLGTELPPFFPDVDSPFKFCALIFGGDERRFEQTRCAFFLHDTGAVNDPQRCFPLTPDDFARVNPNTGTAPVFRTRRDADITRRIYERHPVLVDRSGSEERRVWPVRYYRMFDMTNDSALFRTAAELETAGFYLVEGNRYKKADEWYLPLYQGRMISHFDHRANSVRINPQNTHNPYVSEAVSDAQHADPGFLPRTQYWVPAKDVESRIPRARGWALGFRDIARPTDVRTVVTAVVPWAGYGNKVPLLVGGDGLAAACLGANLSAIPVDFVARQKVQGTNLNWYIVEQLPVIAPNDYDRRFGDTTAREMVRHHVLRLTYTAHDMAPFARALGHDARTAAAAASSSAPARAVAAPRSGVGDYCRRCTAPGVCSSNESPPHGSPRTARRDACRLL